MAKVKFNYGTKANFEALEAKDNDTLYFLTDTLQIFKGAVEYTKSCKLVSTLPGSGQVQGVVYVRTSDFTLHVFNGTSYIQLNKATVTEIPAADASDDNVPTTKAVADYVDAKIEGVVGSKGVFVTDVTYNDGVLSVAKGDITALGIPSTNTTYNDATQGAHGLMSTADKKKLDAFGAASTYALKSDITAMYRYKGSVASYDKLPTSGQTIGDVYDVGNGMNYAWNGEKWDGLGQVFTIDAIQNTEIDTILAS